MCDVISHPSHVAFNCDTTYSYVTCHIHVKYETLAYDILHVTTGYAVWMWVLMRVCLYTCMYVCAWEGACQSASRSDTILFYVPRLIHMWHDLLMYVTPCFLLWHDSFIGDMLRVICTPLITTWIIRMWKQLQHAATRCNTLQCTSTLIHKWQPSSLCAQKIQNCKHAYVNMQFWDSLYELRAHIYTMDIVHTYHRRYVYIYMRYIGLKVVTLYIHARIQIGRVTETRRLQHTLQHTQKHTRQHTQKHTLQHTLQHTKGCAKQARVNAEARSDAFTGMSPMSQSRGHRHVMYEPIKRPATHTATRTATHTATHTVTRSATWCMSQSRGLQRTLQHALRSATHTAHCNTHCGYKRHLHGYIAHFCRYAGLFCVSRTDSQTVRKRPSYKALQRALLQI